MENSANSEVPIRDRLLQVTKEVVKDLNYYKDKSRQDEIKMIYFNTLINKKSTISVNENKEIVALKPTKPKKNIIKKKVTKEEDLKIKENIIKPKLPDENSKMIEIVKIAPNLIKNDLTTDPVIINIEVTTETIVESNMQSDIPKTSISLNTKRNTISTNEDISLSKTASNISLTPSERERHITEEKARIRDHITELINNENYDTTIKPIKRTSKEQRDIMKNTHYGNYK